MNSDIYFPLDIDTQLDTMVQCLIGMPIFFIHNFLYPQQFPSVVIAHTLKAMSLGSKRAIDQFPRILQLLQEFPETVEQFVKKVGHKLFHLQCISFAIFDY